MQVLEAAQTHGPDGHAEIAIACVWRFATEAHPGLIASADFPQLSALSTRLEATAEGVRSGSSEISVGSQDLAGICARSETVNRPNPPRRLPSSR